MSPLSGMTVVDLGAAPGGWTLVAVKAVHSDKSVPWRLPSPGNAGSATEADLSAPPAQMQHDDNQQLTPAASRRPDAQSPGAAPRRGMRRAGRVVSCDLLAMTPVTSFPPIPCEQTRPPARCERGVAVDHAGRPSAVNAAQIPPWKLFRGVRPAAQPSPCEALGRCRSRAR